MCRILNTNSNFPWLLSHLFKFAWISSYHHDYHYHHQNNETGCNLSSMSWYVASLGTPHGKESPGNSCILWYVHVSSPFCSILILCCGITWDIIIFTIRILILRLLPQLTSSSTVVWCDHSLFSCFCDDYHNNPDDDDDDSLEIHSTHSISQSLIHPILSHASPPPLFVSKFWFTWRSSGS